MKHVIAIDGPAGAGKSTVAKLVASSLGFRYLDTGAMYRCVALLVVREGVNKSDERAVASLAEGAEICFEAGDQQRVILSGADVTEEIRRPEIGELASALSVFPAVRRALVARQRKFCDEGSVVMEGRDTTTVVCPDAALKVFLTASIEERARRRYFELKDKQSNLSLDDVRREVEERDRRDSTRQDSPLRRAEDAVVIVTDGMPIHAVVDAVLRAWSDRLKN